MLNGKHDQPSSGRIGQSLIVTGNGNSPLTPDREFETFAMSDGESPHSISKPLGRQTWGLWLFRSYAAVTFSCATPQSRLGIPPSRAGEVNGVPERTVMPHGARPVAIAVVPHGC